MVLIIDNCRAHPTVPGLRAMTLRFLPPNTTAKSQPLDQGIIQNTKVHYRTFLVTRGLMPAVENSMRFVWTILDALYALKDAWDLVKQSTVANCFRHCGFIKPVESSIDVACEITDDDDDDVPLSVLDETLRGSGHCEDGDDLHLFLEVDEEIETC